MGTGVNVQKRLSHLHFLSPPWYPADVEQPHGRILRQGNQNATVGIKWYATKGTYDSTMWQMVARKQKFIEQAFTGDDSVRKLEDVSESSQYEMASALSSGDQRAIQLAGLNADIERLSRLRNAHHDEQATFTGRRNGAQHNLKKVRERAERYENAAAAIGQPVAEMTLKVGEKALTDRAAIGEAVREAMVKALAGWNIEDATWAQAEKSAPSVEIGKVQGQYSLFVDGQVRRSFVGNRMEKSATLTLKLPEGVEQFVAENERDPGALDPSGLYTRLRNRLNGLPQLVSEMRGKEQEYLREIASLEARIGVPFQFETDLFEKTADPARQGRRAEGCRPPGAVHPESEGRGAGPARLPVLQLPGRLGGLGRGEHDPAVHDELPLARPVGRRPGRQAARRRHEGRPRQPDRHQRPCAAGGDAARDPRGHRRAAPDPRAVGRRHALGGRLGQVRQGARGRPQGAVRVGPAVLARRAVQPALDLRCRLPGRPRAVGRPAQGGRCK